jgi:hypothetical protein
MRVGTRRIDVCLRETAPVLLEITVAAGGFRPTGQERRR